MAFRVPSFNIMCDVFTHGTWPGGPMRFSCPCQLRHPEHVTSGQASSAQGFSYPAMLLLVAASTDIRDGFGVFGPQADTIEVPAGSGRHYAVWYVDDVAIGFPNEYRVAYLFKEFAQPVPFPN